MKKLSLLRIVGVGAEPILNCKRYFTGIPRTKIKSELFFSSLMRFSEPLIS